jgi:hypothetical protein
VPIQDESVEVIDGRWLLKCTVVEFADWSGRNSRRFERSYPTRSAAMIGYRDLIAYDLNLLSNDPDVEVAWVAGCRRLFL